MSSSWLGHYSSKEYYTKPEPEVVMRGRAKIWDNRKKDDSHLKLVSKNKPI